jgi:DNA-binding CsgD family transcriptional regulator
VALRSLYRLTPAEARIADLLAGGNEVGEVAVRAGITLETARFHVKRVLAKTGVRRQTELVRLMLSLPGQ